MKNVDVADLEKIELNIAQAKTLIEYGDALAQLEQNANYKKIIATDFFEKNIIRLVKLKAAPQVQDEKNQAYITAQINAVGHFDQYLTGIRIQSNSAKVALQRDAEERELILSEKE